MIAGVQQVNYKLAIDNIINARIVDVATFRLKRIIPL
jgi:hypothetical protein